MCRQRKLACELVIVETGQEALAGKASELHRCLDLQHCRVCSPGCCGHNCVHGAAEPSLHMETVYKIALL